MKRKFSRAALAAGAAAVALTMSFQVKPAHACTSTPFIAGICMFGGNFAPRGWAFTSGQILAINQNQALFSLLGTTYGGDGRTTFALPDLRGRFAMHAGQGPGLSNRRLGQRGGQEQVVLTVNQMPSHRHNAQASSARGNTESPSGAVWAVKSRDDDYSTAAPNVSMSASAIGNTGGSQPHDNMPPYLVVNYIIALQGIFPSRN